jgi:type II secretory pathway pseudopilin PulG
MTRQPAPSSHRRTPQRMRGVVLLALLMALALGGIALMAGVDVWSLSRQREREQELLFVGHQYRRAIQHYYFSAPPGTPRTLPSTLDDLLEDKRYPVPVRHLRRLYPDPITGSADWGLLRIGSRIAGVHSLSDKPPVKRTGFAPDDQLLNDKPAYSGWVFAVSATGQALAAAPASAAASSAQDFFPNDPLPNNPKQGR